MTEQIRVTCGKEEYKFKLGSRAGNVLDTLARMHPPRGILKFGDDAGLVALSQEQLSQLNYTYHPGQVCDVVDNVLIGAVMRLQLKRGKKVEMCGTAVLCSSTGICLTANHCLTDLPRRPNLLIGGHAATICAWDPGKDIAALKICNDIGLPFLKLAGNCLIERMMKVQLVSYPIMADTDYGSIEPTITHSQVVNSWTPNVVAADYASFSNSSGGAVIYKNHLIGIHVESLWQEDSQLEEEVGLEGKVAYLERNMGNKGSLSSFVNAAAICNFLNDYGLLPMPVSSASSLASGGKRGCRMVATPQ